ncbi:MULTISPECIES: ABC transporter permease [unclassified Mesorhizobium]|uniref:ABC transporter permease n=1 Tax=unclassified Mesorhizobium TaxID=325217 RepID=UPI001093B053|nr:MULTISPECIES: ABC transporter permease [unclassified Mesorhizobium]TGS47542.1 ABC transporter permease [Mesorhizobium sp. M8A.F.Ca.ET.182.01.1.1]TGS84168.1 ABC transporter permease [Mesorhizobium sp. M8A.F.Ca.ET.181.01.1.1]
MSAIVAFFLGNPTIVGFGAAFIAAIGWGFHQRLAGASAERAKGAAERLEARTESDKIDQAVAGMSDAEVLKGQAQWSRPKS